MSFFGSLEEEIGLEKKKNDSIDNQAWKEGSKAIVSTQSLEFDFLFILLWWICILDPCFALILNSWCGNLCLVKVWTVSTNLSLDFHVWLNNFELRQLNFMFEWICASGWIDLSSNILEFIHY